MKHYKVIVDPKLIEGFVYHVRIRITAGKIGSSDRTTYNPKQQDYVIMRSAKKMKIPYEKIDTVHITWEADAGVSMF